MSVVTSAAQERARSARRHSGGSRRRELLDLAAGCFGELGYEATTIEVITARAGVSRATFYAYFSSREAVFRAVTEALCAQFLDSQLIEGVNVTQPRQVIGWTTRAFIEVLFANGGLVALIEYRARVDEAIGELWADVHRRTRCRFTAYLERLEADGAIAPCVAPERIVQSLTDALLAGAARIAGADPAERERFIADHIAISERLIGLA